MKKRVLILGATGSIGTSAIDVIRHYPDLFELVGISGHHNEEKLLQIASEFNCKNICLSGLELSSDILNSRIQFYGTTGLNEIIEQTNANIVLNGISGMSGLLPSIAVIKKGIDLALANKETLVMAGEYVQKLAKKNKCKIIPVDSEHSAIFSLIENFKANNVSKIVLTASGGPFKDYTYNELKTVTVEDTLRHPTWNMGKKITIDSATLANKGLEVIEASVLFNLPPSKIQVAIHPQSLVHSLIQLNDGVLYSQISKPDMKHPILNALTYPTIMENYLEKLDLTQDVNLSFSAPRMKDFPMLYLAYQCLNKKGAYPIVYNAANEVAVSAFISGQISFLDIPRITEKVLQSDWTEEPSSIEEILTIDGKARELTTGGCF